MNSESENTRPKETFEHSVTGAQVEVLRLGETEVDICAAGGGYVRIIPRSVFDADYRRAADRPFKLVQIKAGWLEGVTLSAYSNGTRWNGFARPLFPLEEAQKLAALTPTLNYDAGTDAFVIDGDEETSDDLDAGLRFTAVPLDVDGAVVMVYPIGIDNWMWEEKS